MTTAIDAARLDQFRAEARDWLESVSGPRLSGGTDDGGVAVFHDLPHEQERALLDRLRAWQRTKYDAGYGALGWSEEFGGGGLGPDAEREFAALERTFAVPDPHELVSVTLHLIAPTLARYDRTPELRSLIAPMLRCDLLACQLFSEPSAGSDLAGLATRARREGEEWVVDGQKVWTSGAQFAEWGQLLARTDPTAPKHRGITAFMIPLDAPGVEVRPLRQMSGGTSFNEVFFTGARISDAYRIGDVGEGWKVALTTLGFERTSSSGNDGVGATIDQVLAMARAQGALDDPILRQQVADVVIAHRLADVARARDEADVAYDSTAVVGSIRKLQWARRLRMISHLAQDVMGRDLVIDGRPEFGWNQHVLGAPGYRIAGGSDEIQRNLIAERLLGLPPEPRHDKNVPWEDLPR